MARESFQNFGTSALAAAITTTTATTFSVTAGAGSNFPSANFIVVIDTELILVASRSSDTFTVGTRGYDGSTASTHINGATVQMSICSYNFNHIWSNVKDGYHPDIPPVQAPLSATGLPTGTASIYDNEFESLGPNWIQYPSTPSGSSSLDIGVTFPSHVYFHRSSERTMYTLYVPFTPTAGQSFVLTTKISEGINIVENGAQYVQTSCFISDSSNPTSSHDSGNRIRIDSTCFGNVDSNGYTTNDRYAQAAIDTSGNYATNGAKFLLAFNSPVYLRLTYNASNNNYCAYMGDGFSYTQTMNYTSTMTPRSIGLHFWTSGTTYYTQHTVLVDFFRVQLYSGALPLLYGS